MPGELHSTLKTMKERWLTQYNCKSLDDQSKLRQAESNSFFSIFLTVLKKNQTAQLLYIPFPHLPGMVVYITITRHQTLGKDKNSFLDYHRNWTLEGSSSSSWKHGMKRYSLLFVQKIEIWAYSLCTFFHTLFELYHSDSFCRTEFLNNIASLPGSEGSDPKLWPK